MKNRVTSHEAPDDEFAVIAESRRQTLVPVDQPLCLISQLPRSGGTLLLHLFDGHPACHAIPHEWGWQVAARLDPSLEPKEALTRLNPDGMEKLFRRGYGIAQRKNSSKRAVTRVPLHVIPSLQREIFLDRFPKDFDARAIFDAYFTAYFTAYFNAWIDNQSLYHHEPKKWVVAFEPRSILNHKYRGRLQEIYPDGRVISVVREPQAWYASAQGWSMEWPSVRPAMEGWIEGVKELLRVQGELGDRHAIILFSDLVRRPRETMATLSKWLGIRNAAQCRTPTVNGHPVAANTSFSMGTKKVSSDPLKRGTTLPDAERREIDGLAGDLMARVAEVATEPQGKKKLKRR